MAFDRVHIALAINPLIRGVRRCLPDFLPGFGRGRLWEGKSEDGEAGEGADRSESGGEVEGQEVGAEIGVEGEGENKDEVPPSKDGAGNTKVAKDTEDPQEYFTFTLTRTLEKLH